MFHSLFFFFHDLNFYKNKKWAGGNEMYLFILISMATNILFLMVSLSHTHAHFHSEINIIYFSPCVWNGSFTPSSWQTQQGILGSHYSSPNLLQCIVGFDVCTGSYAFWIQTLKKSALRREQGVISDILFVLMKMEHRHIIGCSLSLAHTHTHLQRQ